MFSFKNIGSVLKNSAVTAVKVGIGAAAYFYFDKNIGCLRQVEGASMIPTFNNHFDNINFSTARPATLFSRDIVYFTRNKQKLERGDVVFLTRPRKDNVRLVKRVVGVEGDTITPVGVGGALTEPRQLREGEVWVESDAGHGYLDSSVFGPVPLENIKGVGRGVWAWNSSYWPRLLRPEIPATVTPRLSVRVPEHQPGQPTEVVPEANSQAIVA